MQLNNMSVDSVAIGLACSASTREAGCIGFHSESAIAGVNDLVVEPRALFGHFITCGAPERCLVKVFLNRRSSFTKNLEDFLLIFIALERLFNNHVAEGNTDRVVSNLRLFDPHI